MCCDMLGVVGSNLTIFKFEPTIHRNMVAKSTQHAASNIVAICSVGMLRSFDRGLMCPGFDSRTRHHMWVEFVVGSLPCSKRFFPGTPDFPSPQKPTFPNSNSIWNCQALYHEPVARVIAQALPVFDIKFDIKFAFTPSIKLVKNMS